MGSLTVRHEADRVILDFSSPQRGAGGRFGTSLTADAAWQLAEAIEEEGKRASLETPTPGSGLLWQFDFGVDANRVVIVVTPPEGVGREAGTKVPVGWRKCSLLAEHVRSHAEKAAQKAREFVVKNLDGRNVVTLGRTVDANDLRNN